MWFDELQFKQLCHRKVKAAVLAWSKQGKGASSIQTRTWAMSGKSLIKKILGNAANAAAVYRYDLDGNDQDRSINELASTKGGGFAWTLGLPLVLYFNFKLPDDPSKIEVIIFHIISEDLGFVSCSKDEIITSFMNSLVEPT